MRERAGLPCIDISGPRSIVSVWTCPDIEKSIGRLLSADGTRLWGPGRKGPQDATSLANGRRFGVLLYSYAMVVYRAANQSGRSPGEALPSLVRSFEIGSRLSPAREPRAPMYMVSGALGSLELRI